MSDVYELLAQQAEQQTRLAEKLANELDAMQTDEALDAEERQLEKQLEDVRRRKAARAEKAKEVHRAQLVIQKLGALPDEVRQELAAAAGTPAQALAGSGIPSAWTPAPPSPPSGSGAYPVVPPPAAAAPSPNGLAPGQVVATGGPGLTQPHAADEPPTPAVQAGSRHRRGRK